MKQQKPTNKKETKNIVNTLLFVAIAIIMISSVSAYNLSYDSTKNSINMNYDENNRIINKTGTSDLISYVYDADFNDTLTNVTNSDGVVIKYEYDDRKRVTKEIKEIDGLVFEKETTYDSMDRAVSTQSPNDIINFTYGDNALIKTILNIIDIFYNEQSQPVNKSFNNSLVTNFTYDDENFRLTEIQTSNKQDLTYAYDSFGNVVEINDTANSRNLSMQYDALHRLIYTNISSEETNEFNYTYNAIGNLLNITSTNEYIIYGYSLLAHAPTTMTVVGIASLTLELIYPTTNINATQNEFFNVSVRVTCNNADCGEINVSLDPEEVGSTNSKSYDPLTKEITIAEGFGQRDEVAKIKLLSEQHRIMFPWDYAFEMEFEVKRDYVNALELFEFYKNNINGEKIKDPNYELYVYNPYGTYDEIIYIYETACNKDGYGCHSNVTDSYTEKKNGTWDLLTEKDLYEGDYIIRGYYPDLKEGETIEWVPTLFGVEIGEWADFTGAIKYEWYGDSNTWVWFAGNKVGLGSFTIGYSGTNEDFDCSGISLYGEKEGTMGNLIIEIYNDSDTNGVPDGNIACSGGLNEADVSENPSWNNITLNSTETLRAGAVYLYKIMSGGSSSTNSFRLFYDDTSPAYGGGVGGYDTNNGTGFAILGDYPFEIWGIPPSVDHNLTILDPTNSNPISTSPNENITLKFIYTVDGQNITSNVEIENITLDNVGVPIVNGDEFSYVAGSGWNVNITVPLSCDSARDLFINATYGSNSASNIELASIVCGGGGSTKGGLINTTIGATPFYTNESNPRTISLNQDESQIVTFWVNATGSTSNTYEFFAFTNLTSNMSIMDITGKWNVTII